MSQTLPQNDYSRVIVTVMKDEAPYMLDWIAYHLAIGFTHFIILTNDCSDGTDKIARKLSKIGLVTHKNNPAPHPKGPQKTGYQRMRKLPAFQDAGWMMALDVDEYLRIDVGDGSLDELFSFVGEDVDAMSFVWQLFGNNDVDALSPTPVYQEFLNSQYALQTRPYETTSIKTLFRKDYFERVGTHRPLDPIFERKNPILWIDADGVPLPAFVYQRHWRAYENGAAYGTYLGRVNHYALRSLDGFLVKWARGFVHPNAPTVRGKGTAEDYWKLFNWNDYLEPKELRFQNEARELKSELLGVDNIEKIEKDGFAWHLAKANELKRAAPERVKALKAMGSSQIDETMPDFSQFGSPPSSNQQCLDANLLALKAQHHSRFDTESWRQHYENFPPNPNPRASQ